MRRNPSVTRDAPAPRIAICGLGLDAYWPQFPDLRARLCGYVRQVAEWITEDGAATLDLGMVDNHASAVQAGSRCRREGADLLLLYVTTYALSSTVLALVRRAAVPVVVLNLQPDAALDCDAVNAMQNRAAMTGEWLAWCSACPVPEIANLFARAGWTFRQVTGTLTDNSTRAEIAEWVGAARAMAALGQARVGLMGHYYSGMLDVMTDVTRLAVVFGVHPEIVEVDELSGLASQAETSAIHQRLAEFAAVFDVAEDCDAEELRLAAQTSIALDAFVARHNLDALAYYAKGTGNVANEETMRSIILGTSLLTAQHVPVAGEYEIKNVVAMKIMDMLDAGGSFTEYYAVDFREDVVLMGHDGPGHLAIAEGRTRVRPLGIYHGKVGRGLSVEMSVKHGPVTLLSIAEDPAHGYKMVVAEGESVAGPTLTIGNTNSRYRFPVGARPFVERWNAAAPAHHCAVGVGHVCGTLEKLASLLGIGYTRIC